MRELRRESKEFRNREAKLRRDLEHHLEVERENNEHESFELKWAAEKDVEEYQKEMATLRRESFAQRNKEGRRQREVMNELLTIAKEKETESFVLKWAGGNDVKWYLEEECKRKRESIAFRNKEARYHHEIENEKHQQEIIRRALDEEIRAGCK